MAEFNTVSSEDKYFRIRINSVHPNRPTTFDIFVFINGRQVLYRRAGDTLDEDKIKKLHSKDNDSFFVAEKDRAAYKKYVHSQVNDESLDTRTRAEILRESSYSLVEELFEQPDVETALKQSQEVITNFVEFMDQEPEGMAHLISLSSHDFYTYNHSLDVSIYSLGLGKAAGYSDKDLEELGKGALFHDLGKRHVSADIICKQGPLDDIEWEQMRMHPTYGLKILNDMTGISDAIKACAFEHHENFLGNGYPQQLMGDEIHPMARIVALTDTYDAMTTKRTYNNPMTPMQALTFMKEKLEKRYDPELIRIMYSILFDLQKMSLAQGE
ncbi:MAG: HD domain-containing protein [Bdellovibrionales bacterium]|nr:HD domain-containing protein [Bdellovibrionales bacterium]